MKSRSMALLFAVVACMLTTSSLAQSIKAFRQVSNPAQVNTVVTLGIEVDPGQAPSIWCGVAVEFGDGEAAELRLESPMQQITHTYRNPGHYVARIEGKGLIRGLSSVFPCSGEALTSTVNVKDVRSPAATDVRETDNRFDSLVGTWKNPRPGAESLKVTIRKNQAGELVVQGDDGASSYTLTCRRESGSVACAGPGKMRADGQAFIYRNTIKPAGDKLVENWRVNLASSPDGSPVNSGNDELVRVGGYTSSVDRSQAGNDTLKASRQADGSLFFKGKLQGTPIRFSHHGAAAQGNWRIYSGTPGDRIRISLSNSGNLQELLAMDTGLRLTVRYVGGERVEYRNYSDKGKFLYGAVLYLMERKWMLGLMFTEAFTGYGSLVNVSDVTAQVTQGLTSDKLAGRYRKEWIRPGFGFSLVSAAYAQEAELGTQALARVVREESQAIYFNGVLAVLGGAAATLGPAKAGAVITTTLGVVVESAAAVIASPVVLGVVVGSIAHSKQDRIREILREPLAFFSTLRGPRRAEIRIADAAASEEDVREYADLSKPTRYSTMPAPEAPKPIPARSAFSPTPITPDSIRVSLTKTPLPPSFSQVFLRAPGNFRAVQTGDLSYRLSWGQSDGASGYHIHQKNDSPPAVPAGHFIQSKTRLPSQTIEGRERTTHQSNVSAAGAYCWTVSAIRTNPSSPAFDPEFERSESAEPICLSFKAALPLRNAENTSTQTPVKPLQAEVKAAPVVDDVQPRIAQIGKPVSFVVRGKGLRQLGLDFPACRLAQPPDRDDTRLRFTCTSGEAGRMPLHFANRTTNAALPDFHVTFCRADQTVKNGACSTLPATAPEKSAKDLKTWSDEPTDCPADDRWLESYSSDVGSLANSPGGYTSVPRSQGGILVYGYGRPVEGDTGRATLIRVEAYSRTGGCDVGAEVFLKTVEKNKINGFTITKETRYKRVPGKFR